MIMCVLLCYPVSFHMLQLLLTGCSISSFEKQDGRNASFFSVMKSAYISLIMVPKVWHVKPTYRKSWARNLLMWLDLTFDPNFKSDEDRQI